MTLTDFADETASESPPPGGGSISAYMGALGAALGSMVANLSSHKRGWDDRWEEFSDWAEKGKVYQTELTKLVDEDTNAFNKIMDAFSLPKKSEEEKPEQETPAVNVIRLVVFSRLDDVIDAAHGLHGFFTGQNTLYRNTENETYLLVLHQSETSPEDFNRVCNILSEYGSSKAFTVSGEAYLKEHGKLVSANALQQLVQL